MLSLDIILDYLLMLDVRSHLTNCFQTVQQSSALP